MPSLEEHQEEYGELVKLIILTYDVPSENIKHIPDKLKQQLHSMRNNFYYWLKHKARGARVSDSTWLLKDHDPLLAELESEWLNPYCDFYDSRDKDEWEFNDALQYVFSWYPIWTTAEGVETIKAQVLKNLGKNVEALQRSVERHIQWHKNFESDDEYELDLLVDPKAKKVALTPSKIKGWERKLDSYYDVMGDFMDKETVQSAKLSRQNITDQISTIKLMIAQANKMLQNMKAKEDAK